MTEAQNILKMIETVSPYDTATLDEIDARVWLYSGNAKGWTLEELKRDDTGRYHIVKMQGRMLFPCPQYTRSRDALKSIRPEGFEFPMDVLTNGAGFIFGYGCPAFNNGKFLAGYSVPLPTEELAELHAIIQAIAYERENR